MKLYHGRKFCYQDALWCAVLGSSRVSRVGITHGIPWRPQQVRCGVAVLYLSHTAPAGAAAPHDARHAASDCGSGNGLVCVDAVSEPSRMGVSRGQ